jgi:hypothetical protein
VGQFLLARLWVNSSCSLTKATCYRDVSRIRKRLERWSVSAGVAWRWKPYSCRCFEPPFASDCAFGGRGIVRSASRFGIGESTLAPSGVASAAPLPRSAAALQAGLCSPAPGFARSSLRGRYRPSSARRPCLATSVLSSLNCAKGPGDSNRGRIQPNWFASTANPLRAGGRILLKPSDDIVSSVFRSNIIDNPTLQRASSIRYWNIHSGSAGSMRFYFGLVHCSAVSV